MLESILKYLLGRRVGRGLKKIKAPSWVLGAALRGRRWEGTHRLGCCLLNPDYQFKTCLSSILKTIFWVNAGPYRIALEEGI
jgi:hypothetical protein